MKNEIIYPTQTTYFIAYTDSNIFNYGVVNSNQTMVTGQPYLWFSLDEVEWKNKLKTDFNFIIDNRVTTEYVGS